MALWANTSDGWGSDAGKSGNGQLGTYLQSSLSGSPISPSEKQAGDPSNSMPTASVSRMAQPAVTQPNAVIGGVISKGANQGPADWASSSTTLANGGQVSVAGGVDYVAPTSTALPGYIGATLFSRTNNLGNAGSSTDYYRLNPKTGQVESLGSSFNGEFSGVNKLDAQGKPYVDNNTAALQQLVAQGKFQNFDSSSGRLNVPGEILASQKQNLDNYRSAMAPVNQANIAASGAAKDAYWKDYYQRYIQQYGSLPEQGVYAGNRSVNDASIRQAVESEYTANKAGSDLIGKGITPVDMSQQDAINQSSIAALASRYSTNIAKGDVGSMSRMYASALSAQTGVNHQLSDEAYATGFNRNMSVFNQAVQNQATVDASATGQKLQTDIQSMGDVIAKLQQQTKQLATGSSNQINAQLNDLQSKINDYKAKADKYGADSAEVVQLGKIIIGAVVGVTAIALAPVSGGASIAGGAALGAAILKA